MMGGAVYVPGNIRGLLPDHENKVAEWNVFADPEAARIVFEPGLEVHIVPLDATNQVLVTRQDTGAWRQGGEIADLAADFYDMRLSNWGVENAAIWDLMTAAIMLDSNLCAFEALPLRVIAEAGNTQGQTAVMPGGEATMSACLEPDVASIRQTLIDIFSGSAGASTPLFREDFSGSL